MSELQDSIAAVSGFKVAGVHCGLKKNGSLDFALIYSERPCTAAGIFTTNQVKAAPVVVDAGRLKTRADCIRAVAVNAGCANACTGQQGIDNALLTARWVAEALGCAEEEVLVMSTGVIGTQLAMENIRRGIDLAVDALGDDWGAAARAIMTTDTRPKMAALQTSGRQVAGIAKGAGMIAPDMATMLSVVVTDADLSPQYAQRALQAAADLSYNRIVVDGDMSTNDTVILLANGTAGVWPDSADSQEQFQAALDRVTRKLAQDIVRDGEGVTKFITICITGAPDDSAARIIANTIATSPLVKTAFYGNDANWGRIIAAAGRSGITLRSECMKLWLTPGEAIERTHDSLLLFDAGMPADYREDRAAAIIRSPSVSILLDCRMGEGSATVWTCDLSHEYVSINGDYRS